MAAAAAALWRRWWRRALRWCLRWCFMPVEAGATCLCLTAGKTLIFDREEMIRLAERQRIAVVAAPPV